MKNKTRHGLVTGLTALSTAMICQTSMTYASDIEIYKAPTTGGATLMLALDFSTSMSQASQTPINTDFEIDQKYCAFKKVNVNSTSDKSSRAQNDSTAWYEEDSKTYRVNGADIKFTARFCDFPVSAINSRMKEVADVSCKIINKGREKYTTSGSGNNKTAKRNADGPSVLHYKCPDRVTALKQSIFDMIMGGMGNDPLPSTTSLGFTIFPKVSGASTGNSNSPSTHKAPLPLSSEANKKELLKVIAAYTNSSGTPVAHAYAVAAQGLHDHISASSAACAGYGVYFLTDGEPYSDNRNTARTTFNSIVKTGSDISDAQCGGSGGSSDSDRLKSWQCTTPMATLLKESKNKNNVEIKTAIVGFGKEFRFTNKNNSSQKVIFDPSRTYTTQDLEAVLSGRPLEAAKTAVAGGGGWYSPDNPQDIIASIEEFVESIKVPIPAITTGTAAIPQDYLNPIELQSYAYFPQFQPKPSEDFEAWFGNLKKFSVKDGVLVGQDNDKVFGADGALKSSTKDFWVNGASADLAVYGGLLSKLNLQTFTNGTDFARKVYSNTGGAIQKVDLKYMQDNIAEANNKYLLSALGYDLTEAELSQLANLSKIELSHLANKNQNRSIGAVMHSTPVLLTQSGKITYKDTSKSNVTVDRDDYILFGTTQGALHVVKTGREADTYESDETPADYDGGKEIFTFIPEEMLSAQPKALLSEPNTTGNGMDHLYYGIDGAWTAHTEYVYNSSADKFEVNPSSGKKGKQWVYGGMRMGGSSYYALDLTDIDSPKVKFRIDPTAKTISDIDKDGNPIEKTVGYVYKKGSTTGTPYTELAKMGQSWSKPTIAYVQWKGQRKLVMFVGGGYDPQYEDFKADTSAKGAGVYMFDADTGDLLWTTYDASGGDKGTLDYSVVSQIKAVDREGDGDVDHLYFGDLGGQVFRIDLKSNHTSSDTKADFGKVTRLADFKETGKYAPRFYEMPAFSIYRNASGMFAVLSIGSGNRSTPLLGKVIDSQYVTQGESATENLNLLNDAIYNIYDLAVTDTNPEASTKGPSSIGRSNLQKITDEDRELASDEDQAGEDYNEKSSYKGWYYEFPSSASIGNRKAVEKVQSDLVLLDSDLYVSTFDAEGVGSEEACGAGIYGSSRAHRFCMPYGQCGTGNTVEDNTMTLGKGLLGITLGQSTDEKGVPYRSIIGPVE
ncbi:pilus assembly protein, partial [Acinetobacter pecorum]|uniref:pilus assembly protein n=1 Tax=Acinetobacter pecorum TaxID=2762215 RepID=UPI003EE4B080